MQRFQLLALAIFASFATSARAEEIPTQLLARYVNNDTLVIATARIEPAFLAQLQAFAEPHMVTPVDLAIMEKLKPILEAWGDRRLYVIAGLADMVPGTNGPLMIATAATGEDETQFKAFAEKLQAQLLDGVKPEFAAQVRVVSSKAVIVTEESRGTRYGGSKPKPELVDREFLLFGNKAALTRFDALKPQPRPELVEKLTQLLKHDKAVAAVLAPGPDARRVLREMWPQLPAPYSAITGPLLADRVKQITFTAQAPPEWSAELAIHTSDDETAATLANTGAQVVQQFAPLLQSQMPMPGIDWPAMIETATPKQDKNAVILSVTRDNAAIAKAIANIATAAVGNARAAAQRSQKMNNFKDLGIAFQNFHDTQEFFPASAAICDKDGKPLLSWRVAMLPFIDQKGLYDEFHLDEPWNSEHNLKLLDKMPEAYADPARSDHGGKTTYLVPVHPETVFPPANGSAVVQKKLASRELYLLQGTGMRGLSDGTSNTILMVDVAPENAVPWTKPADWEVDLANPLKGLEQDNRDGFVAGYGDAHVKFNEFSIDPEVLRALLTRAGKELIYYSSGTPKVKK